MREGEPTRFLDVPQISTKTSNALLQEWVKQHWTSDYRKYVALDIVNNGKELLLGSTVDWELVLSKTRAQKIDTVVFGEQAIAANGARFIGGLAARAGWSMHDPAIVYLSGKCLAHIAGSKLEDFKTTMTRAAVSYGQKTLPDAELLMKTLDLLFERRDRNHSNLVTRIANLLRDGKIQEAHTTVSTRGDLVRRWG